MEGRDGLNPKAHQSWGEESDAAPSPLLTTTTKFPHQLGVSQQLHPAQTTTTLCPANPELHGTSAPSRAGFGAHHPPSTTPQTV